MLLHFTKTALPADDEGQKNEGWSVTDNGQLTKIKTRTLVGCTFTSRQPTPKGMENTQESKSGDLKHRRSVRNDSTRSSHSSQFETLLNDAPPLEPETPLTVCCQHRIIPGKETVFQAWLQDIIRLQQENFEGFRGVELIRPTNASQEEYLSIFRYDTYENLQLWMESDERLKILERSVDFDQEPPRLTYHSLEYWFQADNGQQQQQQPSEHKMAVIIFFVIWIQVHFIAINIGKIPDIPPLVAEAGGVAIITILTSYIFLPIITKYLLHWWLFPKRKQKQRRRFQARQEERKGAEEV